MKSHWIAHAHSPNLILFFNGWGMDQHVISHLASDAGHDVLMFYDYRDIALDPDTLNLRDYEHIDVLAWSMGVWAYAQFSEIAQFSETTQFSNTTHVETLLHSKVRSAIAINGTPYPLHEQYGIPIAVYDATVHHFSEAGREKFFRRMCGSREGVTWFQTHAPHRSLDEQREELLAIRKAMTQQRETTSLFTSAIIGRHDKIIPTQHQINYWQGTAWYCIIDSPHFPFWHWKSWQEILNNGSTD